MNYKLILPSLLLSVGVASAEKRPNVVIFLVDDMGYSDIGCYGGEIPTPNIDKLAEQGVRCTQFYNASRSCPTRASLMTGLYQHQTGIGWMSEDPFTFGDKDPKNWGIYEYMGALNRNCVTIAEVLGDAGYHTYITGKWHLGMHGEEKWPLQRGFDRFYGTLAGACSYFRPEGGRGLTLDNKQLPAPDAPYYTTDAFTDYAIKFIDEPKDDKPFFLYLAYNAPHWPLQAKDEDIEKFYDMYRAEGWDKIREARLEKMKALGIVNSDSKFAQWENRAWSELREKEKDMTAYRMAVYAAQVYAVDYNIGKFVDYLESKGELDNTLFFFMSDNGACAEPHNELGGGKQSDINNPAISDHPSIGRAWAQVSNTPFRKYKQRGYEGGISTPLIVSWGDGLSEVSGSWSNEAMFLPDIMPTLIEVADAKYPKKYHNGEKIHSLVGESMMPILSQQKESYNRYLYWEHQGNRVVRWKNWKAVWDEKVNEWELYDLNTDRTELNNLASESSRLLDELSRKWEKWAEEHGVIKDFPHNKK